MLVETEISPPNSMILVIDSKFGEIPLSFDGKLVATNPSCVAIGTLSALDGMTKIVLTDDSTALSKNDGFVAFSGNISFPGFKVSVVNVHHEELLSIPISRDKAFLRIWVNDAQEPDKIVIWCCATELGM